MADPVFNRDDPHTIRRRDADACSTEGSRKVKSAYAKKVVYEAHLAHPEGMTQDDCVDYICPILPQSTITGRYGVMEREGLLHRTGETRMGRAGVPQNVRKAGPAPGSPSISELVEINNLL